MNRVRLIAVLVTGFLLGLFLASLDKILPHETKSGPMHVLVETVDWLAPPFAGLLVGGAMLYAAQRDRLLASERASRVLLAERLQGTERRQALWVIAASIAHDLKNPLHNIQLLMEELETGGEPVEQLLPRLRENVRRASARLGELSRAGQAPEETGHVADLSGALDEVRERLEPAAQTAGVRISVDCPRGLKVGADQLALRSAIEHVAANAVEALSHESHTGGSVQISGRVVESRIEVTVRDDGPGIPERVRERLFTPFASGTSSTGLGLAIARALARAADGDLVCLDSRPGQTTFRFTFQQPRPSPGVAAA